MLQELPPIPDNLRGSVGVSCADCHMNYLRTGAAASAAAGKQMITVLPCCCWTNSEAAQSDASVWSAPEMEHRMKRQTKKQMGFESIWM